MEPDLLWTLLPLLISSSEYSIGNISVTFLGKEETNRFKALLAHYLVRVISHENNPPSQQLYAVARFIFLINS